MKFSLRISGWLLLSGLLLLTGGCRYLTNRYYDFRDTVALGVGVTAENAVTGVVPVALGAYVEATDLLHLGALKYNGYTAEVDLRGTFVGPECTTRYGLLWWQMLQKNQDYENACYRNAFKNKDFPWCGRMESVGMRKYGRSAKELHYEFWSHYLVRGSWMLHRGWQYWEYVGAEAAICEPFLTHMGLMVRCGVDLSEVMDFALGWFFIDFKYDDMRCDEYTIFRGTPSFWGLRLVPARPRREMLPLSKDAAPMVEDENADKEGPTVIEDDKTAAPAERAPEVEEPATAPPPVVSPAPPAK